MVVIKVTDQSFDSDVLKADKPVILDFWADWCGPCKMIAPVLDEIAASRSDLTIAKMNVDENPETPAKFGVRGIPMLVLFKSGEVASTKVGASPKAAIESWIKENL